MADDKRSVRWLNGMCSTQPRHRTRRWEYAHIHTCKPVAKQILGVSQPAVSIDDMSNVKSDKQTKEVHAGR